LDSERGSDRWPAGAPALTYRPFRNTQVRLDGEDSDIRENKAQPWPAADRISPWLNAVSLLSQTYGQAVTGTGANNSRSLVYDPTSGLGPISYFGGRISNSGPSAVGLANNPIAITDEKLLPRSTNLAGPAFANEQYFYNYAVFVEQRLFDHLDLEAAFNRTHERRYNVRPIVFDGIALRGDPNAFLSGGRRNPNAGRYYVEGTTQIENRNQIRDDFRLTASYALDLTRRSPWLGRHRVAGLLSRRDGENLTPGNFTERNLTPHLLNNPAIYPADLTSGNNVITRRTYLDFASDKLEARGLHDVRRHPLTGQKGVTAGYVRTADSARNELTRGDSLMAAFQSSFWGERLWLTGGARQDKQRASGSGGATQDPVMRVWSLRRRNATYTYNEGNTRTYGVVFHATQWLSFYYNNSNNFIPSSQRSDLVGGDLLGNRSGEGQDAGVKLRLFNHRLSANLGRYETNDTNRQVGIDNSWTNHINAIWRTLGRPEQQISVFADSQDLSGSGYEFEVTANLTPQWRTTMNWSITEQITDNQHPRTLAYIAQQRATWEARGSAELDRTGTTLTAPTVAVALQNAQFILDAIQAGNGNVRRDRAGASDRGHSPVDAGGPRALARGEASVAPVFRPVVTPASNHEHHQPQRLHQAGHDRHGRRRHRRHGLQRQVVRGDQGRQRAHQRRRNRYPESGYGAPQQLVRPEGQPQRAGADGVRHRRGALRARGEARRAEVRDETGDHLGHAHGVRRQVDRRRLDRHAEPLACARRDLGLPGRQARLRRETLLPQHLGRTQNDRGRPEIRGLHAGGAQQPLLAQCPRSDRIPAQRRHR
jgi:hypothetical protein